MSAVDKKLTDLGTASTFDASSWFLVVDPTVTTMDPSGTDLKVQAPNLIKGLLPSQAGNAGKILSTDGSGALSWIVAATGGGSGTVTSASVVSANGFGGSVATSTTTPAITITTSITGILKGNGTAISAAASGTDYEPPITAGSSAQYLKGDKTLGTLNQAAVAGLTTASSPAFAGLTVGTLAGLLKGTTGSVGLATAGTDYLTPSGSGASLSGLTASQVGSVPAGVIKGSGGAFAAAVSGTDYEPPITAGTTSQYLKGDKSLGTLNQAAVAGLTTASSPTFAGLTVGSLGGLLKATSGVISAATAGTDYLTTSYAGTSSIVTVGTITSGTWTGTTIALANGGTGQTSASAAFNALSPVTTLGDVIYGSGTNTNARLAGNTTSTKKFLRQTGTGTISAIPAWDTIVAADVPTMVASGASHAPGVVPDPPSSSGSTKFLREDATWAIPAGGSADKLGLTATAVKTTGYTAAAGDFVPCDSTSAGFTVTLPTAPGDGTIIGVKHTTQGSTNSITVAAGGSDTFNRTGGSTTLTLPALARGVICQYNAALAVWYVMTRDFGSILAADVPTLAASQVTAPGSTTQVLYNNAGALAGAANIAVGSSGQLALTPISDPGSPAAGDLWFDTAWKSLSIRQAGVIARVGGIIWQATGSGTAVANTTAATSILTGATTFGTLTIPANSLAVGKIIRPMLFGTAGTTGTPTLTCTLSLGGVTIGAGSSATTAGSGKSWTLENIAGPCGWQVQTIGASGKILGMGRVDIPTVGTITLNTSGTLNAAPTQATIDTTASLTLDFTVQWSVANASNTIQLLGGWVEILG